MDKSSILSTFVIYPIFFFLFAVIHKYIRRKLNIKKEESAKEYIKNISDSYKSWKKLK
ncbi:hypothetical protein [Anaerotignum lactatifermentans]|uniref:hypothetical protein n=1 Tax=Anaerotignum lactatifermentans TaxID=160404 RepID=UPI00174A1E9A|nr:hypothetical protein [Anaerotignum lactatifermentans]